MSASDKLPSGDDPSPNAVLTGVIDFLDEGGTLGTLLQGAIFGTIVSIATGGVNFIQSVFGLIVAPIDAFATATTRFVESTVLAPLGIIETTAETSGTAISTQFGPFALIVGVGIVLGAFWIITKYLQEEETSDLLIVPGFPDIPNVGPFDVGVEEEEDDD